MPPQTAAQVRIAQRGVIIPHVDWIMQTLQTVYPRRVFQKDRTKLVIDRAQLVGDGWRRGGTSPAGAHMLGAAAPTNAPASEQGNYFVGWMGDWLAAVEPQRIIWEPPHEDEETFGPAQSVGYVVYEDPTGTRKLVPQEMAAMMVAGQPASSSQVGRLQRDVGRPVAGQGTAAAPVPGVTYGQGGRILDAPHVTAMVRTRVIPMRCRMWGSDYDDTEELGLQVASVCETLLQGTLAHMSMPTLVSGGFAPDSWGDRGLHYMARVNFCCPVMFPMQETRQLQSFGTSVTFDDGT